MRRYPLKHFLAVCALLALPPIICAVAPAVGNLLTRTERLEALVAKLSSVVVDDTGRVVGPVVGVDYFASLYPTISAQVNSATVELRIDGVPPFLAEVRPSRLWLPIRNELPLFYESEDCSGAPWVRSWGAPDGIWAVGLADQSFASWNAPRTLYILDPSDPPQRVGVRSRYILDHAYYVFPYDPAVFAGYRDPPCKTMAELWPSSPPGHMIDARQLRAVAELDALFTPPFRLARPDELLGN
ncbi:MAG: hypothetical protein OEM49_05735 [Myxococcales bacterium]|nr:hypothetical protein [Myxococcales bacterium]